MDKISDVYGQRAFTVAKMEPLWKMYEQMGLEKMGKGGKIGGQEVGRGRRKNGCF